MSRTDEDRVFLVWKKFQRRAESLSTEMGLAIHYYHISWEERGSGFKAVSYIIRFFRMILDLFRWRPSVVFLQLPPSPAAYPVLAYHSLTGRPFVLDCHNAMIVSPRWRRWPLMQSAFKRAAAVVVHNETLLREARQLSPRAIVVRDLPRTMGYGKANDDACKRFGLIPHQYVLVPGTFAADEPLADMVEAARLTPTVPFVCTWFKEKLPPSLRDRLPPNLLLTGFLSAEDFNGLFTNAGAALVLTTREGTQTSGSIEAMSLRVPLITSDLETSRRLLGSAPIYVRNEAGSIHKGVLAAIEDGPNRRAAMGLLGTQYREEVLAEIGTLRRLVNESGPEA